MPAVVFLSDLIFVSLLKLKSDKKKDLSLKKTREHKNVFYCVQ